MSTTGTFHRWSQEPDPAGTSCTASTSCEITMIPLSVVDGMEDVRNGRVVPLWAVLHLPHWLVGLLWWRRLRRMA